MEKVKIHVWYNVTGQIIAIGQPTPEKDLRHLIVPVSGENQFILDSEIEEDKIRNLHQTHIVDLHKRKLYPKG